MSTSEDLEAIKAQFATLQSALAGISEDDLRAYLKVRDALDTMATIGGQVLVDEGSEDADHAASGGVVSHLRFVHKCAMLGVFEPEPGSGTSGAYDPATVQRFADLGG